MVRSHGPTGNGFGGLAATHSLGNKIITSVVVHLKRPAAGTEKLIISKPAHELTGHGQLIRESVTAHSFGSKIITSTVVYLKLPATGAKYFMVSTQAHGARGNGFVASVTTHAFDTKLSQVSLCI